MPLFKSVARAHHLRAPGRRAGTEAQARCPAAPTRRLGPGEVTGERARGQDGAHTHVLRRPALDPAWPCRAVPAVVLAAPGEGSGGLWVSGRQQGSPRPPRAGTTVPSRPRPFLQGAGGFCPQETFKSEDKGMNRTSVIAAGLEVANDIRLPPLLPILRSPHPGWAPLLV